MQGKGNRILASVRGAWPGIMAVMICAVGLGVWALVIPAPSQLGAEKFRAGLIKPKDIAFVPSVSKLRQMFAKMNYDLEAVRAGERMVPPLFLASVPHDMRQIKQPHERKRMFLRMMLPLVLKANELVLERRARLYELKEKLQSAGALPEVDRLFLKALAKEYKLRKPDIDRLLIHVDVLPVSLALAQSAIESGWGTSRFTREGNAPFGQWTTAQFNGIVPKDRPDGETYKIRSFEDLFGSVRSYIHNLNTHRAYRRFRATRAAMRQAGRKLDTFDLITTLRSYSEEGTNYIDLLREVIAANRLAPLDRARLGEQLPKPAPDA